MKAKIKKLWVAALKSGDYKQGRHRLRINLGHNQSAFCCLGVLCNLHAQAHPKVAAAQTDPASYLGVATLLPREVMEWAGLPKVDGGYVRVNGCPETLTELNDTGTSFKTIANLIDKQL